MQLATMNIEGVGFPYNRHNHLFVLLGVPTHSHRSVQTLRRATIVETLETKGLFNDLLPEKISGMRSLYTFEWRDTRGDILKQYIRNFSNTQSSGVRSFHTQPLYCIDIDTSGRVVITAGVNRFLSIYDLYKSTNAIIEPEFPPSTTQGCHDGPITSVQWYPIDSGMFFTGSMDGTVKVWDTQYMTPVQTFEFNTGTLGFDNLKSTKSLSVFCAKMSPINPESGLIAVANSTNRVRLCDIRSGDSAHELRGHQRCMWTLSWSKTDPYTLMSGSMDGDLLVWDIRRPAPLATMDQFNDQDIGSECSSGVRAHYASVTHIEFVDDGIHAISSASDQSLHLWDMMTGKRVFIDFPTTQRCSYIDSSNQVQAVAACRPGKSKFFNKFSMKGHYVYYPTPTEIRIFDCYNSLDRLTSVIPCTSQFNDLALTLDHQILAGGSKSGEVSFYGV